MTRFSRVVLFGVSSSNKVIGGQKPSSPEPSLWAWALILSSAMTTWIYCWNSGHGKFDKLLKNVQRSSKEMKFAF